MNPFYKREIHVPSDFEDTRLQIDHHMLQESSEKREVVLEPFSDDDLSLGSYIEDSAEEEKFVLDHMDVHIFSFDNMATSNVDVKE